MKVELLERGRPATLFEALFFMQNRIEALGVRNGFIDNQRRCDRFEARQDPEAHGEIIENLIEIKH
jgi:hypothetical protein